MTSASRAARSSVPLHCDGTPQVPRALATNSESASHSVHRVASVVAAVSSQHLAYVILHDC